MTFHANGPPEGHWLEGWVTCDLETCPSRGRARKFLGYASQWDHPELDVASVAGTLPPGWWAVELPMPEGTEVALISDEDQTEETAPLPRVLFHFCGDGCLERASVADARGELEDRAFSRFSKTRHGRATG